MCVFVDAQPRILIRKERNSTVVAVAHSFVRPLHLLAACVVREVHHGPDCVLVSLSV